MALRLRSRGWIAAEGPTPILWFLSACYTSRIVIRGFIGTLLLALGLWGSYHALLLVKGAPASGEFHCTCGCCMHGGTCPMMARKGRLANGSKCGSARSRSHSGFSCSCLVSHPTVPLMQASHSDLFFNLPQSKVAFELPMANQREGRNFSVLPAPAGRLPDPPPKVFSSV